MNDAESPVHPTDYIPYVRISSDNVVQNFCCPSTSLIIDRSIDYVIVPVRLGEDFFFGDHVTRIDTFVGLE